MNKKMQMSHVIRAKDILTAFVFLHFLIYVSEPRAAANGFDKHGKLRPCNQRILKKPMIAIIRPTVAVIMPDVIQKRCAEVDTSQSLAHDLPRSLLLSNFLRFSSVLFDSNSSLACLVSVRNPSAASQAR